MNTEIILVIAGLIYMIGSYSWSLSHFVIGARNKYQRDWLPVIIAPVTVLLYFGYRIYSSVGTWFNSLPLWWQNFIIRTLFVLGMSAVGLILFIIYLYKRFGYYV